MQHQSPVEDSPPHKKKLKKNTFEKQEENPGPSIHLWLTWPEENTGKKGLNKNQSKQEVLDKRVTGHLNVSVTSSSCAASNSRVTAGGSRKDPLWSLVSYDQLTNNYRRHRESLPVGRGSGAEEVLTDGSAQSFCAPSFFPNCLLHLSSVKEATITGSVQIKSIFLRKDCFVSHTKPTRKQRDGQANWISFCIAWKSRCLSAAWPCVARSQGNTLKSQEKGQTQGKRVIGAVTHTQWLWRAGVCTSWSTSEFSKVQKQRRGYRELKCHNFHFLFFSFGIVRSCKSSPCTLGGHMGLFRLILWRHKGDIWWSEGE